MKFISLAVSGKNLERKCEHVSARERCRVVDITVSFADVGLEVPLSLHVCLCLKLYPESGEVTSPAFV